MQQATNSPISPEPRKITASTVRKLLHLGNSDAVSVPRSWTRAYLNQPHKYVNVTLYDDGTITMTPLTWN